MLAAMPREIVGRMIGLQPHRQPAGQPDGVAEARDHRAFRRHHHQVLQPADLADRRRHLRRDPGRERGERVAWSHASDSSQSRKSADRQMRDRRKRRLIMGVDDEPRHLVGLVGNHLLGEEGRERQVGERELRRHALLAGLGRDAGEQVAAAQRRGLGQQRLEIGKRVAAGLRSSRCTCWKARLLRSCESARRRRSCTAARAACPCRPR